MLNYMEPVIEEVRLTDFTDFPVSRIEDLVFTKLQQFLANKKGNDG